MRAERQTVEVEALRRLHVVLRDIAEGQRFDGALRAVTQAVADVIGFEVAGIYLVRADVVTVAAITGPAELREVLEGQRYRRAVFERLLAEGEAWGELRFHWDPRPLLEETPYWVDTSDREPAPGPYAETGDPSPWDRAAHEDHAQAAGNFATDQGHQTRRDRNDPTDDAAYADDPRGRWGPFNALFAPLRSARGHLTGVLAVDLPVDGRLPSHTQCELLEIFAIQTGLALDNRELLADLSAEHERLSASERVLRNVFDSAPIGMWTVSLASQNRGQLLRANEALCRQFGYERDELTQLSLADLTEDENDPGLAELLRRAAEGLVESDSIETPCVRRDGSIFWGQLHLAAMRPAGPAGRPTELLAQIIDVSARKTSEQELAHRAAHDPLTGLLNRTVIAERLQLVLNAERDAERPGAILFCDLDHFKQINDRFGHLVGDDVLAAVGRRIAGVVRRSDSVGRYGGDEFLVLVPELSAEGAQQMAERLVETVSEPMAVEGEQCRVGVSVGVVMLRVDGSSAAAEVLAVADDAMYHAKSSPSTEHFVVGERHHLA